MRLASERATAIMARRAYPGASYRDRKGPGCRRVAGGASKHVFVLTDAFPVKLYRNSKGRLREPATTSVRYVWGPERHAQP